MCMYMSTRCWTINIASGSAYPFTGARNRNKSADNSWHFRKFLANDNSTKIKLAWISLIDRESSRKDPIVSGETTYLPRAKYLVREEVAVARASGVPWRCWSTTTCAGWWWSRGGRVSSLSSIAVVSITAMQASAASPAPIVVAPASAQPRSLHAST